MSSRAMWTCDVDGCVKPAVRTVGDCVICKSHLCAKHASPEYHHCPSFEEENEKYYPLAKEAERDEINELIARIDPSALLSIASQLRDGVPCSFPRPPEYDETLMGGMNYHIEIEFEDGVCWMARIRRVNATSPSPELRTFIMQSEVATLKFLSKTKIPAPRVFHYDFDPENPVGVGYFLMERLPGEPLEWHYCSVEQQRKLIDQLTDCYVELANYPFELMGCLDEPGTSHIGPFAREALTDFVKSKISPIGPVTSRKDFNVSSVLLTMDLILREEAFTDRPIDAFLIYRFLLDCAQAILPRNESEDGKFYLRHADDRGTHILVDEDFNITGIIDWEWAHTDTRSAAFRSPMLLLPVCQFYNGESEPGDNELLLAKSFEAKGHPELSQAVRNGRALHFFEFCCRYDVPDWRNLIRLFHGLRRTVGIDGELDWEEWKKKALNQWRNDHQLQELLSRHPRGRANRKA